MHVVSTNFAKRSFANVNMTSDWAVTDTVYSTAMTTTRYGLIQEFGKGAFHEAVAQGITRPLHATGRKSSQLSSCRRRTTKRVYRSMKGHEERKFQKMSKNKRCCNLSFDIWGITVTCKAKNNRSLRFFVTNEKQCRTSRH